MATGKFDAYTSSDYIGSSAKLKRGDILLGKGHTAIALSNGSDSGVSAPAAGSTGNTAYAGKGIGTATAKTNMNIRSGAVLLIRATALSAKEQPLKSWKFWLLTGTKSYGPAQAAGTLTPAIPMGSITAIRRKLHPLQKQNQRRALISLSPVHTK